MPTYDYMCESCGYEFELFQGITAKSVRKCPACGQRTLKRLIGSGAGVIFKGTGFYQTDYRSESYKKTAEGEKNKADKDTAKQKTAKEGKEPESSQKTESGTKDKKKSA